MSITAHAMHHQHTAMSDSNRRPTSASVRYSRSLHTSLPAVSFSALETSDPTAVPDLAQLQLARLHYPMTNYLRYPGVASKLLLQSTASADDDEAGALDETKARRIHHALEQIRSQGRQDASVSDRRALLNELHSFANTLNGLDVPQAPMATSTYHQQPYGDRLAQTRGDLKLLEQLEPVAEEVLRGGVGLPSAGVVEFVPTVSTSQAELACRWAEQRRQALEQELQMRRANEAAYRGYWPATASHQLSTVTDTLSSQPHRHLVDQYDAWNSALQPVHYPPVVDVGAGVTYTPSASLTPGSGVTAATTSGRHSASSDWAPLQSSLHSLVPTTATSSRPQMSEARRKVRQVLCKSKGDPHFFSRSSSDASY